MKKRTIFKGVKKESFKQEPVSYDQARNILGPCQRRTMNYCRQEQTWQEGGVWETYGDAGVIPQGWFDFGKPEIIQTYDVWINERGDMLLATPL